MSIPSTPKVMMFMLLALSSQAAANPVNGDLDDTTLAFFGGGKKEAAPKKTAPKQEESEDWLTNVLNRLNRDGATPTGARQKMRGQREVVRKAEASPAHGFVQSPVAGVKPPSMFRQSLMRAPLIGLVGMISFFVGS